MIPFSPPRIDDITIKAVEDALRSGWITTGPRTKEFEIQLTKYLGAEKVIALNSWTNACELVLRWYGIGPGDEVIVPAYTYCATANIVMHVGAKPVMVDVLDDFTMDPEAVRKAITQRTKCIIPVDIGGLPARVEEIKRIAEEMCAYFTPAVNLRVAGSNPQMRLGRALVLCDAAHSFGARVDGKPVGTQADITGFSFHAVKNLTTSEGGALAFNLPEPFDVEELYAYINVMSLHGQSKDALAKTKPGAWRYDVTQPGYKCNMTDIQAAIGLVELARYDSETMPRRKKICAQYDKAFSSDDRFIIPAFTVERTPIKASTAIGSDHIITNESSYHLYMLRLASVTEAQRDAVIEAISKRDVSVNVHFQPLPLLSFYKSKGYRIEDCPNAYKHYSCEISLPVYYDLTTSQVDQVVTAVKAAVTEVLER
ncbi:MAG: DegT/DnrJ/EryC1/StrS family aminotransferase [Flavobacteriales bacterium]|nr:DegT/DnrJ/EryC1/StrS family aminotransferase [Flavobacteriales bacterium]MBK6945274.1 DegT/DnrJ/EryC1/StrS family aminotransferase [Flavobacteriales bacterium]MBK7239625.1 DegT/DnrJ/EryC1/StrS family aminotransferase [Flavobacteriales bacterium]MBK9535169.1 DegT/DnrJ/EryC1/StrS family aminotransferase [Flavobacteriales bacterium]MBP9137855.1 DegT/DnrJ/EryC1/StrS family aminotransferase [Flavobacteriales bacterium]